MSKQLKPHYFDDKTVVEIGIDEAGKGPLFGRVYAAAVILPKDNETFEFNKMKDSKKFSSKKKREQIAEYIKTHCLAWSVAYADEKFIDKNNIRQATFHAMHTAIRNVVQKQTNKHIYLLVDGNDFKPFTYVDAQLKYVPDICITKGDNLYCAIAAASILAKVTHDEYIDDLCRQYPKLQEYYDLHNNKGYGTAKHIAGIEKHGISEWHRKTYNRCTNCAMLTSEQYI